MMSPALSFSSFSETAGVVPVGSIVGGFLGEFLEVRSAMGIAAIGFVIAPPLALLSPVPKLSELEAWCLIARISVLVSMLFLSNVFRLWLGELHR